MIDTLVQIDIWLFLKLNAGAANPLFDRLMPVVTEFRNWAPFIAGGFLALAIFGGGKGRTVVLFGIILIAISDQLSSHVIKQWVGRPRPCHNVEGVRLLYRCGKTLAFPSSHAATTMAAAVFFGFMYRRLLWLLLAASILVSYSRTYLGVHYPLDSIGGWMIGGSMAALALWAYRHQVQPFMNRFPVFRDSSRAVESLQGSAHA